jgi:hypothetical protein
VTRSHERYARPRREVEELLRGQTAEPEEGPARVGPPRPSGFRRGAPPPSVPAPPAETIERPTPVEPPTQPIRGRGGAQHRYLQELVRRWAEGNGWRAEIEERILDGLGSVDVGLRKGERSVACEIAVTTEPEHEVRNVQKCLAAGFERVVVVSSERRTLNQVRASAASSLPEEQAGKVACCTPEELFDLLDGIEASSRVTEQTVRGYRVKVRIKGAEPGETEQRRRAVAAVVAKAIRGLKRGRQQ